MGKLKRKAQETCIFCGAEGEVTDEHIFPESWYPSDTPPNTPKWKAPSCYECNHKKFAPIEARIFPFLAMTAEPDHPGAMGIADRGFRAVDESAGSNVRDRGARRKKLEQMRDRAEVIRSEDVPEGADHLGWRHQYDELLTTSVDENDMLAVIGKIARGVIFLASGSRVDERYSVHPHQKLSLVPAEFRGREANVTVEAGPGIKTSILSFMPHLAPPACFMQITIWDTLVWYVTIAPKEEFRKALMLTPSE